MDHSKDCENLWSVNGGRIWMLIVSIVVREGCVSDSERDETAIASSALASISFVNVKFNQSVGWTGSNYFCTLPLVEVIRLGDSEHPIYHGIRADELMLEGLGSVE